ncbi:MAG TPA: hypothetical protein EYQ27_16435, partial [Gemmatimonadetes bacterium]|nr:hypothetical protein [Gemmatimonadota bacterium]
MANGETIVEHRLDAEGVDPLMLTGVTDRNLQEITRIFGIRVVMRGDHLILSGSLDSVERAVPVVQHMIELSRLRAPFDVADIGRFADGAAALGPEGIVLPDDEMAGYLKVGAEPKHNSWYVREVLADKAKTCNMPPEIS